MNRRIVPGLLAASVLASLGAARADAGRRPSSGRLETDPAPVEGRSGDASQPGFTGSDAYVQFRKSGREVVRERAVDLDGDGLDDVLVIGRGEQGLDLSAYRNRGRGDFVLLTRSAPVEASQLASFAPVSLGRQSGFILDAVEDSPDEADHTLCLFVANPAGLVRVFSTRYRVRHLEEEAGRTPVEVIDLGGLPQGLHVRAVPKASARDWPVLELGFSPKSLKLFTQGDRRVQVVIGMVQRIFAAERGRYELGEERFVDYLRPIRVRRASARPASADHPARFAADGDLTTAWLGGVGGTLRLAFPRRARLRAVRLVPGCAASEHAWRAHARVRTVSVELAGQAVLRIDRTRPNRPDPRLLGLADFSLPGLGFGFQTLVFFRRPVSTEGLQLVIEAIEPGENPRLPACLAEVTAMEALVELNEQSHNRPGVDGGRVDR